MMRCQWTSADGGQVDTHAISRPLRGEGLEGLLDASHTRSLENRRLRGRQLQPAVQRVGRKRAWLHAQEVVEAESPIRGGFDLTLALDGRRKNASAIL